jgi:hypothetical protein
LAIAEEEENAAYTFGYRLLQEKDLAAALKLFSLLRLLVPAKALYGIAIAATLFAGKSFFDAALHYLDAYVAQPERPELALWAAWSLIQDGRCAMAASLLRVILALRSSPERKNGGGRWEDVHALLAWAEEKKDGDKGQIWGKFFGRMCHGASGEGLRKGPAGWLCREEGCYGGEDPVVLADRILTEGLAVLRSTIGERSAICTKRRHNGRGS